MKNTFAELIKNSLLALILFMTVSIFSSCGGDDDGDPDPKPQPTITSIEPAKGEVGDEVIIKGTNFSTTASDNNVSFNGAVATVMSATATEIKTTVPATATTGNITVTIDGLDPATSSTSFEVFSCASLALELTSGGYSITAEATGGAAPYQYALGEGSFQSDNTFDVEAADATVKVKDANGCEATASITAATLKTFTDERDDQEYKIVKIGDQIWMAENLNIKSDTAQYCYDDLPANCEADGALYTWHAAKVACPAGWKLPDNAEWETLITNLGGFDVAGGKMKVGGSSGLEMRYVGFKLKDGDYYEDHGIGALVWSFEEDSETRAWYYAVSNNLGNEVEKSSTFKPSGLCVRCLKVK